MSQKNNNMGSWSDVYKNIFQVDGKDENLIEYELPFAMLYNIYASPLACTAYASAKGQIAKFITSSTAPEHLDGVADMPLLDSSAHNICTGICVPPTTEHLHVNCVLPIEHVQADTSKDHRNIHTSLCSRLSEAGGMRSAQMRWDSPQLENRTSGTQQSR